MLKIKVKKLLSYRGYYGNIKYSPVDRVLYGKVIRLPKTFISYEGNSLAELEQDFHNAIDAYIEACEEYGEKPKKSNLNDYN